MSYVKNEKRKIKEKIERWYEDSKAEYVLGA